MKMIFRTGSEDGDRMNRTWVVMTVLVIVAVIVGAVLFRSSPTDTCDNCMCAELFDRDPRYAAIQAFDEDAFRAMRTKAEMRKERGPACRVALNSELGPVLADIVRRAFHEAPDREVIEYIHALRRQAEAWARIDPASCASMLEGDLELGEMVTSSLRTKLPEDARKAAEQADARLIESAHASGRRSPSFTAQEADEANKRDENRFQALRDENNALNPKATPKDRCQGDLKFYELILETPDPARVRGLRYMLNPIKRIPLVPEPPLEPPKPDLSDIER